MTAHDLPTPRTGWPYRLLTIVAAIWVTVVIVVSLLGDIAWLPILEHTARNLYFHLPLWLALFVFSLIAAYHSVRVLQNGRRIHDVRAEQAMVVSVGAGLMAMVTGVVWGRFTWYVGTDIWWNGDPRQVMVAVQLLIGGAYFVLRGALEEPRRRARIAAAYCLFAATTLPFLIYVLPRRMASLHPGAEGNPAFSEMDIAPQMRIVLYSSLIGFQLLFYWIYVQRVRTRVLEERRRDREEAQLVGAL
ncbi:MAG: cytochrome C assembly protein [Bacteroidota bacterium]